MTKNRIVQTFFKSAIVNCTIFFKRDWVWKDPLEDSNWITLPVSGVGGSKEGRKGGGGVYVKSKVERGKWQRMGGKRQDKELQEGKEYDYGLAND